MASRKQAEPIQIVDGAWYAAGHGGEPLLEECCDCGLVHRIRYKIENGRVWYQYARDEKATKAARKRRGIAKP